MDYSSQSGTIKNQLSGVNDSVSNINGIDFDSVWSGEVHDQLVTTLNKVINDVNTTKENVEKYTEALELLQQYKEIVEKIEALEAELASIPEYEAGIFGVTDAINAIRRASIEAQINELTTKKTELYNKVTTILNAFLQIGTNEIQTVSTPTTSNFLNVPLFYQSDYTDINYGTGTLATHGCGITSLAMVASYYNDTEILPDELAEKYHRYGSESGTDHMIFSQTAEELQLPFEGHVHYSTEADLNTVVNALSEGSVVIAKAKSSSVFTNSGHYIVLTGVTEDGKITVNDPNKYNYKEYNEWCGDVLTDGFENGFDQEQFKYGKIEDFFIYSPKS